MAKGVKRASSAKKIKSGPPLVTVKSAANPGGINVRVSVIDANSATFTSGLQLVFKRNVAKARKENIRVVGQADNKG